MHPAPVAAADAFAVDSFAAAVRRTARSWLAAMVLAAATTLAVAHACGVLPCVHAAMLLLIGLVGIPLLFPLALGAAMLVLWALLAVVAAPWWLVHRRATGLADLGRELGTLLASLLPGYWRALRRVDRPVLWGLLLGFVVGTATAAMLWPLRAAAS